MKSKVQALAIAKGINTPQDLSYEARISWPTAKNIWDGNISNTRLETVYKVSRALGCKLDDLFVFEPNQKAGV